MYAGQPPQPVSHSMRPAEDFLTFPQSAGHESAPTQHRHQPGSLASPPQAPQYQAPTQPERSSTHVAAQPASLHANPQNPAPSPQRAANRVPWALSPPKNDPLRPRTQGEGTRTLILNVHFDVHYTVQTIPSHSRWLFDMCKICGM